MSEKKHKESDVNSDGNESEGSHKKDPDTRQDLFVCFTNEKDLRHYESIRIKSSLYTGIAVRVKNLVPTAMDNLLYAIELDQQGNSIKAAGEEEKKTDKKQQQAEAQIPREGGLVNLRFEECRITRKAANSLAEFLKKKQILETLGFVKVSFEDIFDFKKILEGVQQNTKLSKVLFSNMIFDEEMFGKSIARALIDSRSIREIDLSYLSFDHPKCFYDISSAILNERCRLNILKIRGTQITNLEGKIIQYILMKNKQIHTLDLSFCRTDDPENFICFLQKLDQFCNIRYLTFDGMQPDLSSSIEVLGESLASNTKLEVLIMRENKIKWVNYCNFWSLMIQNTSLQKINLQKTDLSDRVLEKMVKYLEQPNISLVDLDISKNGISDVGLKTLCISLKTNKTLKFLNLSGNKIKEEGIVDLVDFLSENKTLQELSLGSNIISNEGITILSRFLGNNSTLQHLEIPKNSFTDVGFEYFAKMLEFNKGLKFLDIAKNKDLSDEASLIALAEALEKNRCLQTLDLSSLKIRKPYLKQHLEPALKKNINLQKIIGKIPPGIIEFELETNIIIEKEIMPLYQPITKILKGQFNLKLVESEQNLSRLDLKDQQNKLVKPAFKFIKYFDIRSVDFSNLGIHDEHINLLGGYLRRNPNLRSIVLDRNPFTDDGLTKLTQELKTNTKLAHLSIRGCPNITDDGLRNLCDVICTVNTVLFQIDLDPANFDKELARKCVTESALNRDIQEKLKPQKILSELNFNKINSDNQGKTGDDRQIEQQRTLMISQYDAIQRAHNASNLNLSMDSIGSGVVKENMSEQKNPFLNVKNLLEEVIFDENAPVAECFASVLKAWRIHSPNVIQVMNQNLTDVHLIKLCEFLKNRNMITILNLRRNKISNEGAKALADLIKNFDNSITHLDVTRNRIGADGGQQLLDALSTTTRIVEFEIKYGNPISSKMGRIFEREIKANLQTNQPTKNKRRGISKYELIDRGPDYMRCAIKMTELQNIVHLSLPNNMLSLEDARMLADMINKNTPLKTLNLSQNELDADCAALIANALIYNSNLTVLNLKDNRLGDLGVQLLIAPLIRKQLQQKEICCKQVPVFNSLSMKLIKKPATTTKFRNNLTLTIMANIQMIDLTNNITTEEMFKNVCTLLKLDQKIILETDDPKMIREAEQQLLHQQIIDERKKQQEEFNKKFYPKIKKSTKNKIGPSEQKNLLPGDSTLDAIIKSGASLDDENKSSSEESEDEDTIEARKLAEEKKRLAAIKKLQIRKECNRKCNICLQKFCCFKDDLSQFDHKKDIYPNTKQICCWRLLRAR